MAFSIDSAEIEISCPRCGFWSTVTIRQVRTRDVIICRGCKSNVRLEDHMNQVRSAERQVRSSVEQLTRMLEGIGRIELRI